MKTKIITIVIMVSVVVALSMVFFLPFAKTYSDNPYYYSGTGSFNEEFCTTIMQQENPDIQVISPTTVQYSFYSSEPMVFGIEGEKNTFLIVFLWSAVIGFPLVILVACIPLLTFKEEQQ